MAEPISLAQAKLHLRVDTSDEDDLIEGMIADARSWVEDYTGQTLVQAPHTEQINGFADLLLTWPVISLTAVKYLDANGDQQTLEADLYELNTARRPARLRLKGDARWPAVGAARAIEVEMVAGYADADAIPGGMRRAMYVLLEGYYSRDAKAISDAAAAAARSCGPNSRGWRT